MESAVGPLNRGGFPFDPPVNSVKSNRCQVVARCGLEA